MATILLIDDDVALLKSVTRWLASLGHEVHPAPNGLEALQILDSVEVALVLSDINMPEMDGIEVLAAVAERDPAIPVVAMSGGGLLPKELLLDNASVLGAVATIRKPFTPDELRAVVEEFLAGPPGVS